MKGTEAEVIIQVERPGWRTRWARHPSQIRHLIAVAAPLVRVPRQLGRGSMVVVLSDDRHLRALNGQFRGKDKPTNVLSFPDADEPFGGIALALETIEREAREQGKPFVNHAKHMILHGFLHLLGYDHQTEREARLMERLETAILAELSIPNPYEFEDKTRA